MKWKLKYVCSVLVSLIIAGCGWTPPWEKYYAKSYIAVYRGDPLKTYTYKNQYNVVFLSWGEGEDYAYDCEGNAKYIYQELCVKHQDTECNRWFSDPYDPNSANKGGIVYWKDFVAIDVVSDRDFDTEHLAGSSLGDVVEYGGWSYWEYIKNNYTGREENYISGYINDLPEDGLCLVKELFLYFNEVPESAVGEHNLTITITADDGTVYNLGCTLLLDAIEE